MIWEKKAEATLQKVPFFVLEKVRQRVEAFVEDREKDRITLEDVNALKEKFFSKGGMESEIKGYDVSKCFGGSGCPNAVGDVPLLAKEIEGIMKAADLLSFLKTEVKEDLKFHHEFRVSISGCPNACSRPQIADIGIIAAAIPGVTDTVCSACESCVQACPDAVVVLTENEPQIDAAACLSCARCIRACPTGTLKTVQTGYRLLLGGRLGRRPRLGMELEGIFSFETALDIVRRSLAFYKTWSKEGKRFSHILDSPSCIF